MRWYTSIDALVRLSLRLKGPFNIETVVVPIDVKISDAIMIFQENAETITDKVAVMLLLGLALHATCGLVNVTDKAKGQRSKAVNTPLPLPELTRRMDHTVLPATRQRRHSRHYPYALRFLLGISYANIRTTISDDLAILQENPT